MKKQYLVLLLFLVSQVSLAQARFEYDQAGNRVKRTVTPYPDLSPQLIVSPSTAYGTTTITAKLRVIELNGVPTSGPITVRITKDASLLFSFSQSTTSVGGTSVQNANWSFDDSDDESYFFRSNTVIPGGAVSVIGLTGILTAQGSSGTFSVSMAIVGGSGGEIRVTNNIAVARIDYFPN